MLVILATIQQIICSVCRTPIDNHDAVHCDGCKQLFHEHCLKTIGDRQLCVFCQEDDGLNDWLVWGWWGVGHTPPHQPISWRYHEPEIICTQNLEKKASVLWLQSRRKEGDEAWIDKEGQATGWWNRNIYAAQTTPRQGTKEVHTTTAHQNIRKRLIRTDRKWNQNCLGKDTSWTSP